MGEILQIAEYVQFLDSELDKKLREPPPPHPADNRAAPPPPPALVPTRPDAIPRFLCEPIVSSQRFSSGLSPEHCYEFRAVSTNDGCNSSIFHCANMPVPGRPEGAECVLKVAKLSCRKATLTELRNWFKLVDALRARGSASCREHLRFPAFYGVGFLETVLSEGRKTWKLGILMEHTGSTLLDVCMSLQGRLPTYAEYRLHPYTLRALGCVDKVLRLFAALHELGFGCGDAKPGNITLQGDKAWLIDLGTLHVLGRPRVHPTCSPCFRPPEDFLHPGHGGATIIANPGLDIYSVGVTVWQLLSPFAAFYESRGSAEARGAYYEHAPFADVQQEKDTHAQRAGASLRSALRITGVPPVQCWSDRDQRSGWYSSERVLQFHGEQARDVMDLFHTNSASSSVPDRGFMRQMLPSTARPGDLSLTAFWAAPLGEDGAGLVNRRPAARLFPDGSPLHPWDGRRGSLRPDLDPQLVLLVQGMMHPIMQDPTAERANEVLCWADPRVRQNPVQPTRRFESFGEVMAFWEPYWQEFKRQEAPDYV